MRFLAVVLILCALLTPVLAQQNFRASAKKAAVKVSEPLTNCSMATHSHRYEDIRLAMVEVTTDDDCGFGYVNLESNATGLDNRFQYGEDFLVAHTTDDTSDSSSIRSDVLTRKAIHQGTRGIAFYCEVCKAIVTFKVITD